MSSLLCLLAAVFLVLAPPAHAQDPPPGLPWFYGYLEDAGGQPVSSPQPMSFAIHAAA